MDQDQIRSRTNRSSTRALRKRQQKVMTTNNNANVTRPEEFVIDPYKSDLNPGKAEDKKLYLYAIKELDESKRIQL